MREDGFALTAAARDFVLISNTSANRCGVIFQRGFGSGNQSEIHVDARFAHNSAHDRSFVPSGPVVACAGAVCIVLCQEASMRYYSSAEEECSYRAF